MSLTLYKNKEIVWTAMYHLMKGGTFFVNVHNTVGASSPPANDADEADWYPSGAIYTYWLGSDYSPNELNSGGTAGQHISLSSNPAYDTTLTNRTNYPQISFVVGGKYDSSGNWQAWSGSTTYTHLLWNISPSPQPSGNSEPFASYLGYGGLIHESSAVTLSGGQTKTYNLDLFAEWD